MRSDLTTVRAFCPGPPLPQQDCFMVRVIHWRRRSDQALHVRQPADLAQRTLRQRDMAWPVQTGTSLERVLRLRRW